jgi:callose synthase
MTWPPVLYIVWNFLGFNRLYIHDKSVLSSFLGCPINMIFLFFLNVFPLRINFCSANHLVLPKYLQAVFSFITMQLQLCSVFFTFSLGTRTHYFGRTILHGGAKVCQHIFLIFLFFLMVYLFGN